MSTDYIDFSRVYRIESIPSRDSEELAKKGLGTFPGITQIVSASWNDTLKKYPNQLTEFGKYIENTKLA